MERGIRVVIREEEKKEGEGCTPRRVESTQLIRRRRNHCEDATTRTQRLYSTYLMRYGEEGRRRRTRKEERKEGEEGKGRKLLQTSHHPSPSHQHTPSARITPSARTITPPHTPSTHHHTTTHPQHASHHHTPPARITPSHPQHPPS
jgi:hypothetical protein